MRSLEPDDSERALDTLSSYVTNQHLIAAMWGWYSRYLRSLPFVDAMDHPVVLGAVRLEMAHRLMHDMHDLLMDIREIADEEKPADAVERIVALIDNYDIPFVLGEPS